MTRLYLPILDDDTKFTIFRLNFVWVENFLDIWLPIDSSNVIVCMIYFILYCHTFPLIRLSITATYLTKATFQVRDTVGRCSLFIPEFPWRWLLVCRWVSNDWLLLPECFPPWYVELWWVKLLCYRPDKLNQMVLSLWRRLTKSETIIPIIFSHTTFFSYVP